MKKLILFASAVALAMSLSGPARADAKIWCKGGPQAGWTSIERLKTKLVNEGWTLKKVKKVRDCYEVYGKTPEGDNVESFFHPVTLQKLLVLKRGKTLFREPGY
jgi:hypothetical protein